MPERSWKELVAEGRKLLAEEERSTTGIKWHWADLAFEIEPPGATSIKSGAYARLRKWAEEIGWFEEGRSFDTLIRYRDIAAAWPPETRCEGAVFSTHEVMRNHPDRASLIRPGLSPNEGRKLVGRKVAAAGSQGTVPGLSQVKAALADPSVAREVMADPQIRHVVDESRPTEEKVEQARRALRDPTVARQVHRDPDIRPTLMRAAADVTREMEDESRERQRERAPGLVGMSDFYEAAGELNRMRRAGMKALDAMYRVTLDGDQREGLRDASRGARDVLDWIDSYLEKGDRSHDEELTRLLSEET